MFSLKGEPEDQVRLFCEEMTRVRAQNVAIVMDGPEAAAQRMKEILTKAGTNVFDEIHFVKTAKLAFLDKFKPEEKADLLAFVERVVANLQ